MTILLVLSAFYLISQNLGYFDCVSHQKLFKYINKSYFLKKIYIVQFVLLFIVHQSPLHIILCLRIIISKGFQGFQKISEDFKDF